MIELAPVDNGDQGNICTDYLQRLLITTAVRDQSNS